MTIFSTLFKYITYLCPYKDKLQHAKDLFPDTEILRCDVTDEHEVLQLKQRIEELGGIDILYNNAGEQKNNAATGHGKGAESTEHNAVMDFGQPSG